MATKTPVLVALLHELAKTEIWGSYADLAEALKTRAARLHLPYDSAAICAAIIHVEFVTGRPLVATATTQCSRREAPPAYEPIGRAEAASLYTALLARAAREKVPA